MLNIFSGRSSEWSKIRKIFINNNDTCSACGRKDKLEVHHIEPIHVNPYKELDMNNLITLCKSCHFTIGHLMDWNSWNIDVINDARVYLTKVQNRPYQIKAQSNENNNIFSRCFFIINKYLRWN